jgi:hypothetical protein
MPHSTTEPEACSNCGAPDIASPEAGWIAGKPQALSGRHGIGAEKCFTSAPHASKTKCSLGAYTKIN